jgi:hypothetical protein
MSITLADFMKAHSEIVVKKAMSEYLFNFAIGGKVCRTWCDIDKKEACFDCPDHLGDVVKSLSKLSKDIERVVEACASKTKVNVLDIREFVFKHTRAMIRVDEQLQVGAMEYGLLEEMMIKPKAGQKKQHGKIK